MRIETPVEIKEVAWEGYLDLAGEAFRDGELPRVTVGEPAWWAADALEAQTGRAWSAPAGGECYNLLRLACTLHPPKWGSTFADATLTAYLRPAGSGGQAVAHDLFPLRETAERKGMFRISVGPDLKFAGVDASLGEVGLEIELYKIYPVVQAFGLGESTPYWRFERHSTNPLVGSQHVYAVVAAPAGASAVRLTVELVATMDTGRGLKRFKTPEKAEARISRSMPLRVDQASAGTGGAGGTPDIAAVRELLKAAFSVPTLRIFCQDRPVFEPLLTRFGPNDGLEEMVARVIDHCREKHLWQALLDAVKADNPGQWTRFEGRLRG